MKKVAEDCEVVAEEQASTQDGSPLENVLQDNDEDEILKLKEKSLECTPKARDNDKN